MSKAKLITESQYEVNTTIACSNYTKSKVLALKKIGETYDQIVSRVCTEYAALLSTMPNNGVISR